MLSHLLVWQLQCLLSYIDSIRFYEGLMGAPRYALGSVPPCEGTYSATYEWLSNGAT